MNEARVAGTRAEDARIDARDATRVHGAMLAVTRTLIVYSHLYRYPLRCAVEMALARWIARDRALCAMMTRPNFWGRPTSITRFAKPNNLFTPSPSLYFNDHHMGN